jgi:hypothetical protein
VSTAALFFDAVGFFANIMHPLEDLKPFAFKVLKITHKDQTKEGLPTSTPQAEATTTGTLFSFLMTLLIFALATYWKDGVATVAIFARASPPPSRATPRGGDRSSCIARTRIKFCRATS